MPGILSSRINPSTWENDQFFDPSDIYNQIVEMYSKKHELSEEEVRDMVDRIAYHESKLDPSAVQRLSDDSPGLGRGLFQFEVGEYGGAETAIQRFKNYFRQHDPSLANINIPEDFSTIPGDMQRSLFLINLMATENRPREESDVRANLASAKEKGERGLEDLWINYHWKGYKVDPDSISARRASFQRDMTDYDRIYKK